MITRISLIRHGETEWNKIGRWQGHAPVPLNEEGVQQAALLAGHLAALNGQVTAIYSSDLLRAFATAQAIAARLGLSVQPDARLREIDLGEWQGLTSDEIRAWDGERYQRVSADPFNTPRPGGESVNDVAARTLAALHSYVEAHQGGHVLAVTHGGSIRIVLTRLKLIEDVRLIVGNTSLTTLAHNSGQWVLETLNQTEHLGARKVVIGSSEG